MKDNKMYFKNIDSTNCFNLQEHLNEAKDEGLNKITLVEAIPDDNTNSFIWCSIYDVVEKSDCKKSLCPRYESKSGRGVCSNKGSLYLHGEEVTFDVG